MWGDCLDLDSLLNESDLLGRQVIVKDDEVDIVLLDKGDDFLKFALTHIGSAVRPVTPLQESAHGGGTSGLSQEFKFKGE